jgi:hypothetical protein
MKSPKRSTLPPKSSASWLRHFLELPRPRSSADGGRRWTDVTSIIASSKFWLIITGLVTLLLFGPYLGDWFQGDDFLFLRAARFIGPLGYIKEAFDFTVYNRHSVNIDFLRDYDIPLPFLAFRPFTFIGYEGMYLMFGQNPTGYHAMSLVVHLANTLLVWLIASRVLKSRVGSHMAALVFALHPAYVMAVSWISDIGTLLATFTALLSLLLFMKSTDTDPPHGGWYLASIVLYGGSGFFHQETMSWLAVFVACYFLISTVHRNRVLSLTSWSVFAPYTWIFVGSYALQLWIVGHTPAHAYGEDFHFGPHMLAHFKNFLSISLYPTSSGHTVPHFVAFLGMLLALAFLPAMAYLARRKRALPRGELFVILWFLASLAPLLTIAGFLNVGALNRKLYPAGPALAIFLVMFGSSLLALPPPRLQTYAKAIAGLLLVPLAVGAMALARDALEQHSAWALEEERFVQALRDTYPSLPEGSTLYVVDAPDTLIAFGDYNLLGAVQAFYGKVDAYHISKEEAMSLATLGVSASSYPQRVLTLDANDRIFWYESASR